MTRRLQGALSLCLTLSTGLAAAPATGKPPHSIPPPATEDRVLAIVDVTVVPMDREIALPHQTVVVVGRTITQLGPVDEVTLDPSAERIDGRGLYLLPGLADMHAHVRRKKGQRPEDYLEQGITTVRNMAGEPDHLEFRDRVRAGELAGPIVFTAGQPLTSSDQFRRHRQVSTAEEGRAAVRKQVADGYDFIKIYSLLSREAYDGILAEANERNIPVGGHVTDSVPITEALGSGLSSIEHLFGYFWYLESADSELQGRWAPRRLFHAVDLDPKKLAPIAEATARAGVWNCPTLWRKDNYLTAPMAKEAWETPELRRLAETNRRLLVKALHDAGAGLLAGTDDEPKVIHDELALFVEAGLTPFEALRTATVAPGNYLAVPGLGTIAVGSPAHFLLLEANPLEAIENTRSIHAVVVNGTRIPR